MIPEQLTPFPETFFARNALEVARDLLGALVVRHRPEGRLVGRIVETEAYLPDDPACHGVRELPDGCRVHKQTKRNAPMFGPPGRAYVYFTYGNHFMFNVIAEPEGIPAAVLFRAVEPLDGVETMARLRGLDDLRQLSNGPGKLAKALAINATLNGHDLSRPPLQLAHGNPVPEEDVVRATRIGISKAVDEPWRFYVKGNAWVSRK